MRVHNLKAKLSKTNETMAMIFKYFKTQIKHRISIKYASLIDFDNDKVAFIFTLSNTS